MGPYEKLFIYEISDEISLKAGSFGRDFIGCWNEGGSSFLFFSQDRNREVREWLTRQGRGDLLSLHVMDYRDWQAGEELKSFQVEKFLIVPSWEPVGKVDDGVLIRLDPGVVFGTGFHPTTRACLKTLWDICQRDTPQRVLDIGTGTGILAIAAAKLGVRDVFGIDHNQLAVETARNNVLLNGVQDRVTVTRGKAESVEFDGADVVLANLHFQAIDAFLRREKFVSTCWIVLSGLLSRQADGALTTIKTWPFKVHSRLEEHHWVTLVLRRLPSIVSTDG
jgi:ribosomal protein L11 methyltransferase